MTSAIAAHRRGFQVMGVIGIAHLMLFAARSMARADTATGRPS